MRAKVGLGIVAATLVTFGLIACNSLFCQSPAPAEPLPLVPPPPVTQVETQQPPPPVQQARNLLTRFTISVSPIFEGGAIGAPVPLTVEIRGDGFSVEGIPPGAWQKKLPDKVKEALESAVAEAASKEPAVDSRLDEILDRLDRIEKRLKQIERKKSGK